MGQMNRIIKVFVASPDDVKSERRRLEKVIQGQNQIWSRIFNARFELIRWETHGKPGFGEYPQDVLNKELPDDYEVFIGVMWCKFGTPTGRAGSGTEEEFNRAYCRFKEDPSSVRIMFYFKEASISPGKIDPVQLARLREFRKSLGSKGGLYWTFKTGNGFEDLVRNHLTIVMQDISNLHRPNKPPPSNTAADEKNPETGEDEEIGLIERLDQYEESVKRLEKVVLRIGEEVDDQGRRMRERTAEANEIIQTSQGQVNRNEAKRIINRAASDLREFVDKMGIMVPQFDNVLHESAESAAQIVTISISDTITDKNELMKTGRGLGTYYEALTETHKAITEFQESIQGLPRMTTALTRAKKAAVDILQQFLDSMESGRTLLTETLRSIDSASQNYDDMPDSIEDFIAIINNGGLTADSLLRDLHVVERCARCADEIIDIASLNEILAEHYNLPEIPDIHGVIESSEFSPDHLNHNGVCELCGYLLDKDD